MKSYRESFLEKIEKAKISDSYRIYLDTRDAILFQLDEWLNNGQDVSQYWLEELAGFEYLLDSSPLIVEKLRQHCYHITGLYSYTYRKHHAHRSGPYRNKLSQLKQLDRRDMFIGESSVLGGFGYEIDGYLINLDTLKFYESLIAMDLGGVLDKLEENPETKKVVLEIGAGWGGMAYQFKTLFPDLSYVIIDLPQTLQFSIIYLKTLFPDKRFFVYGENASTILPENLSEFDFVFLPAYRTDLLRKIKAIDLAINLVSFQEMTNTQINQYIGILAELTCPSIYSHNRDRSPHNSELDTVSKVLERYYDLHEVQVLGIPYTKLEKTTTKPVGLLEKLKSKLRDNLNNDKTPTKSVHEYRHLVGSLRPEYQAVNHLIKDS